MKLKQTVTWVLLISWAASLTNAGAVVRSGIVSSHFKRSNKIREYVEGELLIELKDSAKTSSTTTTPTQVFSRHGGAHMKSFNSGGRQWSRVRFSGKKTEDAIAEMKADPSVKSVQPNYIYHAMTAPNDPNYSQMWGLKNTGQSITTGDYATHNPGTSGDDMNLESAWSLITDCSAVTIAVVDSGINYNQEDLTTNLWDGGTSYPNHGYNFVDGNTDPMDLNGHGSHVAGTIGAIGNNGIGGTGVCWKANIMALRVLDASGSGTTADIVQALTFAVNHGAKVINMSLGSTSMDSTFQTAVQSASDAGLVIVVAAGNDGANNDSGTTPTYPCNYTSANLVCVAALDQAYGLASFSNYGTTSVDIGAPGTNVLSTYAGHETDTVDTFHNTGSTTLNWTNSGGGWAYGQRTLSDGTTNFTFDMLLNPSTWDGSTVKYANNLDARVYKTFNLAGAVSAQLGFSAFVDVDASDSLTVAYKTTTGDPFSGGTALDQFNGTTSGSSEYFSYDLGPCLVSTCSVGLQLKTDASTNDFGVGLLGLEIISLALTTNGYNTLDGTSMATPHVAGLATMLFAYNPSFTAADVVNAIKMGGIAASSLSGKTTTGKSASAYGSLTYIAPVTCVSASVSF